MVAGAVTAMSDPVDCLYAGLVSACVACRLRFGDAQHVRDEPFLDVTDDGEGFLELPLGKAKNANTLVAGTMNKAAVGQARGLRGKAWAIAWLELRKELGLGCGSGWVPSARAQP